MNTCLDLPSSAANPPTMQSLMTLRDSWREPPHPRCKGNVRYRQLGPPPHPPCTPANALFDVFSALYIEMYKLGHGISECFFVPLTLSVQPLTY